jgi:hypothetical protein
MAGLDSRQSLSPQALGGEHAGMISRDYGHSTLWNGAGFFRDIRRTIPVKDENLRF